MSDYHCLSCSRPEEETPLISLRYKGRSVWLCSSCLPTLIHAPQKLAGKLENAENISPAPNHPH
jgi:hypothetical protein